MVDAAPASAPPFTGTLAGQTALVTGAGRGLGRACALALCDAGADVVLLSRTRSELEAVANEIAQRGGNSQLLVCDVKDGTATQEKIESLARLDILVNNAGANQPQPFLEVGEDVLDHLLGLNVKAAFQVAQACARLMVRAGSGAIINMSSQMGHVGSPGRTVYCATKHAIEGLTKAMAVELAPMGVRVNTVAPTFVDTPLTKPFFTDPKFTEWVNDSIPLGRIATTDEVAGAVVFLASPSASMITGTSLVVDGGWTAK